MSINGQSRAAQIKAKHRQEVTLPSGNTYLIRKLTNRDYLEEGVLRILLDPTDDPHLAILQSQLRVATEPEEKERLRQAILEATQQINEPKIRAFYDENKEDSLNRLLAQEDRILRRAVIDPPITDVIADDSITLADLSIDRLPLLAAIAEFAGFGTSKESEHKKSGDAPVSDPVRDPAGVAG